MEPLGVAAAADQRRRPLLWVGGVPDTAGYVAPPPRRAAAAARVRDDFSRRRMPTICLSGGWAALPFELDAAGRRRRFGHLPGGAEAGAACGRSGPRRQPPVRPSSRLLAIAPPDRALGATEWMQQGDLERRVWS